MFVSYYAAYTTVCCCCGKILQRCTALQTACTMRKMLLCHLTNAYSLLLPALIAGAAATLPSLALSASSYLEHCQLCAVYAFGQLNGFRVNITNLQICHSAANCQLAAHTCTFTCTCICICLALVCTVRIYVELTTFLAFIAISYHTFSALMLSCTHAAAYSKLFAQLCSDKICQLV